MSSMQLAVVDSIEIEAPTPGLSDFQVAWGGAYEQADAAMGRLWAKLRAEWLAAYKSVATRRAYATATEQWLDFLVTQVGADGRIVQPWAVDAGHVRTWLRGLEGAGLSAATINQRLAACSSWYSFIINERHLVNGIERSAFFDAAGNTRQNPFHAHNIQRPEAVPFRQAHPLSLRQIGQVLGTCNQKTLSGARAHAFLLTTFLTGWRVAEVTSMQWGRIRPHRSVAGKFVYEWRGKGDKTSSDALPGVAYHAILHYLRVAGRIPAGTLVQPGVDNEYIRGHEFVWQVISDRASLNLLQFGGEEVELESERHFSPQTANRILRTALGRAGLPVSHRIHDLRHSLAHAHYQEFKDVKAVQMLLHHSSSAVTDRYLQELADPIDTHSEVLYQQMLGLG